MSETPEGKGPQEQAVPPPSPDMAERSFLALLAGDLNSVITGVTTGVATGVATAAAIAHMNKGGGSVPPAPPPAPEAGPPPSSGQGES